MLLLVGCAIGCADNDFPVTCPGEGDYQYADEIVDAPGRVKSPSAVDVPHNAINGVVEGDPNSGSLDVYSRGLSTEPPNNYLVLRWSGRRVIDTPGRDFVIFENAFRTSDGAFMDPAIVEVSLDGERWVAFEHDYVAADETEYSNDPAAWQGFAGVTPVAWQSRDCTSPFVPEAGGDSFDLAELDDAELSQGFTMLRLTAAATQINPDTGVPYPRDAISDGFDIDGVFARATEQE